MAISLTGITSFGKITSENNTLTSNLLNFGIPGSSSNKAIASALMGKVRTMSITGIFPGTNAQIKTFVDSIDTWVNLDGYLKFQATRTFTDSLNGTYDVMGNNFAWDRVIDSPNSISYTLDLVEGKSITKWVGDLFTPGA